MTELGPKTYFCSGIVSVSWDAIYQGAKESKATPLEVAGRHTTSVTADIGYLEDHQNAFIH